MRWDKVISAAAGYGLAPLCGSTPGAGVVGYTGGGGLPLLRSRCTVHLRVAHVGPAADGERLVAPMRAAAPALIDTVSDMPYAAAGSIHNDPVGPLPAWDRGGLLRELPAEAVSALLAAAAELRRRPGRGVQPAGRGRLPAAAAGQEVADPQPCPSSCRTAPGLLPGAWH